eukprot:TRINITY_DN28522_c0_g1_i1.p1 TRINITY_DN28522_c0_g1~~TRINITY_DN28522_c0_g1_i1.p1  ORF type:complete len:499 (+),score=72.77 TRINITY_DN28522_c0_g1_i1:46-1497(+)
MAEEVRVPREVTAKIRSNLARTLGPPAGCRGDRCFTLLSWNVDGISEEGPVDLMRRTLAVAQHISEVLPAAVFLQEVVPPQLELLSAPQVLGSVYDIITAENPKLPYYCAMLVHKKRVRVSGRPRTTHFPQSKMGRHLLAVDVVVDGCEAAPLTLMTTHLESMKDEKTERVRQFVEVLSAVTDAAARKRTVVVAGDLNSRDDEVVAARKQVSARSALINNVADVWMWCGSPKAHQFTWDTSINTNLGVTFSSRCRFDRAFFSAPNVSEGSGNTPASCSKARASSASRSASSPAAWSPVSFELVGRSKIDGLGRFPSDHWGIQMSWDLLGGAKLAGAADSPSACASASSGVAPIPEPAATNLPLTDEERTRRREGAAARAEARVQASAKRGLGVDSMFAAQAMKARKVEAKEPDSGSAAAANKPVEEEESEEAMLQRAIALSLQAVEPSAQTQVASTAAGDSRAFASLSKGNAADSVPAVIDLD